MILSMGKLIKRFKVTAKVILFILVEWLPRYFSSPFILAWRIISFKKNKPTFVMYHFSKEHSDFSYWLASLLVSFTPGTIAVNYDEKHLLVHLFDENDQQDVTKFLSKFMESLR